MRSKLVLAVLFIVSSLPAFSQVAPAVKISGFPLGVGAGISDYFLDYGTGRRMVGVSAWADYTLFHGLGVDVEGTSIFAARPSAISRMKQNTIKLNAIYRYHELFHLRPYVKGGGGLASIDFPSRNPLYTHDTFTVYDFGGGLEYRAWRTLYVRADYEYQTVVHYESSVKNLNPNGFTIGATFYLRGVHGHK